MSLKFPGTKRITAVIKAVILLTCLIFVASGQVIETHADNFPIFISASGTPSTTSTAFEIRLSFELHAPSASLRAPPDADDSIYWYFYDTNTGGGEQIGGVHSMTGPFTGFDTDNRMLVDLDISAKFSELSPANKRRVNAIVVGIEIGAFDVKVFPISKGDGSNWNLIGYLTTPFKYLLPNSFSDAFRIGETVHFFHDAAGINGATISEGDFVVVREWVNGITKKKALNSTDITNTTNIGIINEGEFLQATGSDHLLKLANLYQLPQTDDYRDLSRTRLTISTIHDSTNKPGSAQVNAIWIGEDMWENYAASEMFSLSNPLYGQGTPPANNTEPQGFIGQQQQGNEGQQDNTEPQGTGQQQRTANTQTIIDSTAVAFSEIMYDSRGGLHSLPQWIELHNYHRSGSANLNGWKLQIEGRDANGKHRNATIRLEAFSIPAGATALIVTWNGRHSDEIQDRQIYQFFNRHSDEFEQNDNRNQVISVHGFYLKLLDRQGQTVDVAGNLDGNRRTKDTPAWELPSVSGQRSRARASIMRRYNVATNTPLDGRVANNWKSTATWELGVSRYWGRSTDIGNPGYRDERKPLPVTLSSFSATWQADSLVIRWTTESELNNAGFNIYRSETKNGEFKGITPAMIQGAGTTSQRTQYTYTDTTAQPGTLYYYQIEDASYAGVRQTLATTRLRGLISPKGKRLIHWADVKNR